MQSSKYILFAGRTETGIASLFKSLIHKGINVETVETLYELIAKMKAVPPAVIAMNTCFEEVKCHQLIPIIKALNPDSSIIIISSGNDPEVERGSRIQGIIYYAIIPDDLEKLPEVIEKAVKAAGQREIGVPK